MVKDVINKLLNIATFKRFLSSNEPFATKRPGELIQQLTPHERDILKTATADDFNHPQNAQRYADMRTQFERQYYGEISVFRLKRDICI